MEKTASSGLTIGVWQAGQLLRRLDAAGPLGAALRQRRHDLRDHVARAHHHHLVADPYVLARQVLLVVEGGRGDCDAAHLDRLQHRKGHQVAGAADVPDDVEQLRRRRRRRELPGDRPARLTAHHAQLAPERPLVDLDDYAVDLVVELVATLLPPAAALHHRLDAGVVVGVGVDLEAALAQPLDLLAMGGEVETAGRADAVAPDRKRSFGGERGVQLADRARGRVPRVGKGRFAGLGAAFVEGLEVGDRQVDLAPDFDQGRRVVDAQRDRLDRSQVLGHVLADAPVAAGCAADEDAVLIGERYRQPVDLRLGGVAELGGGDVEALEVVADARLPGPQLLLVAGVAEREHLLGVLDLGKALKRRRPDALRGRVGRAHLGVLRLDRPQLVEQRVVLVVADRRVVEDVVAAVVLRQLLPQLSGALLGPGRAHTDVGALAASISPKSQPRSFSRPPWSVRSKWIGVTEIRFCATALRSVPSISS